MNIKAKKKVVSIWCTQSDPNLQTKVTENMIFECAFIASSNTNTT